MLILLIFQMFCYCLVEVCIVSMDNKSVVHDIRYISAAADIVQPEEADGLPWMCHEQDMDIADFGNIFQRPYKVRLGIILVCPALDIQQLGDFAL